MASNDKLQFMEWRLCHSTPSREDAQRMLRFQADGSSSSSSFSSSSSSSSNKSTSIQRKLTRTGKSTLPVMPDATAYLQSPDTHWNSPFKADLRNCKAEVQFQGEVAAKQVIGLDQGTELKADIEKTIQAARPVNHINGQPYDLDDPEYQKLIRTMLPTVGNTKSQSSGSRNQT